MKKNILAAAIVSAAVVGSVQTMAYDTPATVISGDRTTDVHTVLADFSIANNGTTSVDAESLTILAVKSQSSGAEVWDKTGTFDSSGNPTNENGDVTTPYVKTWLPNLEYAPGLFGFEISNGTGTEPTSYHLETNASGKITGGYFFAESVSVTVGGQDVFSFKDFDFRQVVTLNGCTGGAPDIDDAHQIMNGGAVLAGCDLTQHGVMDYLTCDSINECGQLSKSVPVPAFASAVLALGLVGITLVTSRRRSIK